MILNSIAKTLMAGVIFLSAGYLTLKAPQMHSDYMRQKVGSTVSMLMATGVNGGGTGFQVITPSGKQLTLTNRHVCNIPFKPLNTKINGVKRNLKILKVSKVSDLCVLEGIPELPALRLAKEVKIGEGIAALGHPQLLPLALTRGELMGYMRVGITEDMVPHPSLCPKGTQAVQTFFAIACLRFHLSGVTNVTILPGSSGSPMVNFWGNIVGVVFAGDNSSNWGLIVPLNQVREFLRDL